MVDALPPLGAGQKTAVISGGSSGIGLACARILCMRGYHVTLLARDEARLEAARRALRGGAGQEVATRRLDVVHASDCEQAIAEIAEARGGIDWLITCAGMVEPGLFETLSLDSHRRQMETNYVREFEKLMNGFEKRYGDKSMAAQRKVISRYMEAARARSAPKK